MDVTHIDGKPFLSVVNTASSVTALRLSVAVILDDDGVSRHVSHLRRVPRPAAEWHPSPTVEDDSDDDDSSTSADNAVVQSVQVLAWPNTTRKLKLFCFALLLIRC